MQIKAFAHTVLHTTPYPYQLEVGEALVAALTRGQGGISTIMMPRQSGKNELSAILEAYLLATKPAGTIIKAAPTYTPPVINSRMRLMPMLESPSSNRVSGQPMAPSSLWPPISTPRASCRKRAHASCSPLPVRRAPSLAAPPACSSNSRRPRMPTLTQRTQRVPHDGTDQCAHRAVGHRLVRRDVAGTDASRQPGSPSTYRPAATR